MTAGRALFDAGNFAGAERMFRQVLTEDPEFAAAHALLSLTLYRLGKSRAALEAANAAIAITPSANAFRAKTLALLRLNRKVKAIEAARAAVAEDPTDELACLVLGMAMEQAERFREAEAAYRRAVEIVPTLPGIRAELGRFLLRRQRFADAEAEEAQIDPTSDRETVLLLRGEIAVWRGRTEDARDYALWVLSRDATSSDALRLLTQVKASQSVFLGLWWRYSLFMATKPKWLRMFVILPIALILMFLVHGLAVLVILYLFISRLVFARMVRQELKSVTLKKSF